MSRLRQEGSALAVLGLILLGALALRLWNLDHGLPFAYNADEAEHFVPRALAIAGGGGLDPGYYENPPSLTYLLALVYWIGGTADDSAGGVAGGVALATWVSEDTLERLFACLLLVVAARLAWSARR